MDGSSISSLTTAVTTTNMMPSLPNTPGKPPSLRTELNTDGPGRMSAAALPYTGERLLKVILVDQQLCISFRRTVKVPNVKGQTFELPPDMRALPLFPVEEFKDNLPKSMADKGGLLMPMYQSEAMWIHFSARYRNPRRTYLVRIFAGNVNVISGRTRHGDDDCDDDIDTDTQELLQDYVVIPGQNWVDGVAVAPGVVRQFLACPLDSGETVESLVTGWENQGGIQFEVLAVDDEEEPDHEEGNKPNAKEKKGESVEEEEEEEKEEEEKKDGISDLGMKLQLHHFQGPPDSPLAVRTITFKALTGRTWQCKVKLGWSVWKLKKLFLLKIRDESTGKKNWAASESELCKDGSCSSKEWGPVTDAAKIVFIFAGMKLEDDKSLESYGIEDQSVLHVIFRLRGGGGGEGPGPGYEMGIGAGGRIKQNIHEDDRRECKRWPRHPGAVDCERFASFNVQILNTQMFQEVVGLPPPKTPMSLKDYEKRGGVFFMYPEFESKIRGEFAMLNETEGADEKEWMENYENWKKYRAKTPEERQADAEKEREKEKEKEKEAEEKKRLAKLPHRGKQDYMVHCAPAA